MSFEVTKSVVGHGKIRQEEEVSDMDGGLRKDE